MIWFLGAIIILLPTYLIKFSIFQIPTNLLEMLIYFAFIIEIIQNLFYHKKSIKVSKLLIVSIILFVLAAVFGVLFSSDKTISLGVFKGWIIDPLLFFYVAINNIKNKKDLLLIIKAVVLSGFLLSFYGLSQLFSNNFITDDNRISSFYSSANYLALFLGPTIPFSIYLYLVDRNKSKFIWLFIVIILLLTLFLTYSYAAWIAVILSVLTTSFFIGSKKTKFYLMFLVFLVLGGLFISQLQSAKYKQIFDFENRSSLKARVEIWQVSWYLVKKNPITGIGLGNFEKEYQENLGQVVWPPLEWTAPQPHNIFLAFWLNMGLLGLVSFIMILYYYFQETYNQIKNNILSYFLLTSMFILLFHGLLDTPFWKNDLSIFFWLLIAIIFSLKTIKEEKNG